MKIVIKIFGFSLAALIVLTIARKVWITQRHKFKDVSRVSVSLPHAYKTTLAEELSVAAFNLSKSGKSDDAIILYRQAIRVEPDNPRLFFDLAECYSRINRLEQAIFTLDTAILIDKSIAAFYNNRGLNYYKLDRTEDAINDFKTAIQLDSTNWVFFANIALVYKSQNNEEEACRALRTANRLGLDLNSNSGQDDLEELIEICE